MDQLDQGGQVNNNTDHLLLFESLYEHVLMSFAVLLSLAFWEGSAEITDEERSLCIALLSVLWRVKTENGRRPNRQSQEKHGMDGLAVHGSCCLYERVICIYLFSNYCAHRVA